MKFNIKVEPFEPEKLKVGMLVMFGEELLQINGREPSSNHWYIGTAWCNISLEPEFFPASKRRVFQPVHIVEGGVLSEK